VIEGIIRDIFRVGAKQTADALSRRATLGGELPGVAARRVGLTCSVISSAFSTGNRLAALAGVIVSRL
jgi:hypothetical protein